jgi:hypothetical protein
MLKRLLFALFVVVMLSPVALFAQTDPLPDVKKAGIDAITAMTPVVGLFVLWALKLAWSKIPASLVLIAGPVLGIVLNYGIAYMTNHPAGDPVLAAFLGAVATWLREFGSTVMSKGVTGSVSATKASF